MKLKTFYEIRLESAKKMAELAEKKAKELGVSIVFSVVDRGGNLILLQKMENAYFTSIDISINKAFTSVALKISTDKVAPLVQPGESLYGLQLTNNCRIVPFGGGIPIEVDGQIVGAVGISGGTVEEDIMIAEYSLNI
jgi:uncharacterized protein GlcG (DUF336 family)